VKSANDTEHRNGVPRWLGYKVSREGSGPPKNPDKVSKGDRIRIEDEKLRTKVRKKIKKNSRGGRAAKARILTCVLSTKKTKRY